MRSRARHLARLGLRRHRHQDTDKHIDRRHRWAVIGGPEQDNTQYSPLIGPSETRQPGTSPSSGEKMTAWRRVWSSLRGPRTGDTRWWPRLSPTKTYRWVSRPNRGITFFTHTSEITQKRHWIFIPGCTVPYMLPCCGETVVTDLPALDLLLYGCLPWNVPLLQFIALLEYRWRLRGGLQLAAALGCGHL